MRAMAVLLAVVVAGCGKRPADVAESDPPTSPNVSKTVATKDSPSPPRTEPTKPTAAPTKKAVETVGPVPFLEIQNAYKDNELAADAKWRGKRVIVDIREIVEIGRAKDRPYISTRAFGHSPPPTGFFFFADGEEAEVAKLKKGFPAGGVRVVGGCVGKKEDMVFRGIQGYEFTVLFMDAKVVR